MFNAGNDDRSNTRLPPYGRLSKTFQNAFEFLSRLDLHTRYVKLPRARFKMKPAHHHSKNTPPRACTRRKIKKTDLVEALHHHVRHVLIKHGGWYDDLIKGFVVAPQSWIGRLLLAAATQRGTESQRSAVVGDDDARTHWRSATESFGYNAVYKYYSPND